MKVNGNKPILEICRMWADRLIYCKIERQIDKQIDIQIDRKIDRWICGNRIDISSTKIKNKL